MVDEERKLDYIPVDLCVRGMLVAAYKVCNEHPTTKSLPIYNATSIKKPSFRNMNDQKIHVKHPSRNAIMYVSVTHTSCWFLAWTIKIFEQIIPALVLDGLLRWKGRKPK